jgi:pimeloyl-ACP methyl ester carboxylesterase
MGEAVEFTGHGVQLTGDRRGDADAPPALLLHGGGQTRHSWGGTATTLANAGWLTINLDLRGHGDSDWHPQGDYSLDGFARDVRAVIDTLSQPPVLVGASLGGLASLLLEGEMAPGSARAIVLVDVVPQLNRTGTARIKAFMSDRVNEGFGNLEEAADAIAAYNTHRPPPTDLRGLSKNLRQRENGRWYWHWDPAFMLSDMAVNEVNDHERLRAAARSLRVPVLLVRGRMSDVVSPAGVDEFLGDVPHAEFADVSGAGHMVAGDRNDAFTASVTTFLANLEPVPRTG